MPKVTQDYYWPVDGHFTHKGYEVLAQALKDALMTLPWFRDSLGG
jgi:hypothetical protein